jgi:hypothetical protein
MTANELKKVLDAHLDKLVLVEGDGNEGFYILVAPMHFEKAKYSCTTDERDFSMYHGRVFYKGLELSTTKGLSPYRK